MPFRRRTASIVGAASAIASDAIDFERMPESKAIPKWMLCSARMVAHQPKNNRMWNFVSRCAL
jgi:hypothetical protein